VAGGAAMVYKASDLQSDMRHVAIKLFAESQAHTRLRAEFFGRECRALQELRHPSIIELLDWGTDETTGERFLVLDWMEDTLESRRGDSFEGWDSFYDDIGRPILEALSFAHGRRVWHRDLKPANVLLDAAARPRLADFSIAKVDQRWDPSRTVGAFGSPPFTAPENDDGTASGSRDCWSYAAIVLYCLTQIQFKDYGDIQRALARVDVPEAIEEILKRCLSNAPALRPETATVLLAEIGRVQDQRAAAAIRRRRIHLCLSRERAERVGVVVGASTKGDVERVIAADLQQGAAFQPYLDPQQQPVAGHFRLLGTEFTYHAAIDGAAKDRLRIINAMRASVVSLEQRRDRAFQPHVDFSFAEPQRPHEARAQLEALSDELDEFLTEQSILQAEREAHEIFRAWRGILQLKSDLQRKLAAAVRYRGFERGTRGRIVFHLSEEPGAIEPDEVRVVSLPDGRTAVRGEVEEVAGRRLTLYVLEGDYDSLPRRGELRLDTYAAQIAVDRQKNAVDAAQYGRSLRGDLGALLVTPEKTRRPQAPRSVEFLHDDLDEAKQEAVRRALGAPDLLAVEGPPGTGKTTFIAEVVLQTLRENPEARILLASQTHVALDNALERVGEREPDLAMIRVGRLETGKVGEAAERWLLEQQLERWRRQVVDRSRAFIDRWAQEHGLSAVDVQNASALEQVAALNLAIGEVQERIRELQAAQEASEQAAAGAPPDDELTRTQTREQVASVTDELDEARRELHALRLQRKPLLERLVDKKFARNERELREIPAADLRERAKAVLVGGGPAVHQLRKLLSIHSEWIQRFGRSSWEFKAALMARAQVVGATCIGFAGAAGTLESQFDLCIVDEASRATPTEALVPMTRARRWILVGDPRQLPPFVDDAIRRNTNLSDFGLTRDQLEGTLLDRMLALLPDECQTALTIQHRMAPPIGALVSECFYGGRLENGRGDTENPYALVFPHRVTWVTTSGLEDARESRNGTSVSNEAEVRTIRSLLKHLDFVARGKRLHPSVVLLAGYANQCERLERTVASLANEIKHLDVEVHTVDSFQGREADVAVYSVTRSNDDRKLGFLGDERRLNVALSRGRDLLVIVGDTHFCRTARGENPLKPVLEHVERHVQACEVKDARDL
jgi:AAA domain/Protein kinase domain